MTGAGAPDIPIRRSADLRITLIFVAHLHS
jgi:hypothetical protein